MVGEVFNGHAVNTRRTFVGLHPFPCLRQVVAGQRFCKQFSIHLSLRLVSRLGACWPPPTSGPLGLDRFGRGFHVCSLCLIVWPLGAPTPGHLLWPLLTSALSRPALLQVALYSWTTLLPVSSTRSGQLATALGSWYPGGTDPGHVIIHLHRMRCRSPQVRVANCLCTSAAFTLSAKPVGFAVMCQLASALWALTMRFLSVASHICTRASSRRLFAGPPLPSASG